MKLNRSKKLRERCTRSEDRLQPLQDFRASKASSAQELEETQRETNKTLKPKGNLVILCIVNEFGSTRIHPSSYSFGSGRVGWQD